MSGGSHIRAVGPEAAQDAQVETTESETAPEAEESAPSIEESGAFLEEELYYEAPSPSRGWLPASIAILAVLGWTGFYGWALRSELLVPGTTPQQWAGWIVDWSIPVLLIGVCWLIAMRNSRREAARFAETASLLSHESAQLEERLSVVNRELSLAREFLGSQSLELESLGRIASERLATHAEELQQLITDNGAQVDRIGSASETALGNMNRLRDDLPVIATSARDVSNQVGNAGRTAQEQLEKLVAGFERLNQFGEASERQVEALSGKIDATLASLEAQMTALEEATSARFEALTEKSEEYRTELDNREVNALAAMRQRADDLRAGVSELDAEFAQNEEQALTAVRARIAMLRGEGEQLSAALRDAEASALDSMRQAKDRLHTDLAKVVEELDGLDKHAMESARKRVQQLHEEAAQFDDKLAERDRRFVEEMTRRQDEFDTRETQATEVLAQRLAELDEALAERREAQLAETEKLVGHGREVGTKLEELNTLFGAIAQQGDATRDTLEQGLGSLGEQLAAKRAELTETETQLGKLTDAGVRLLEIIQSGARQSREDLSQAIENAAALLTTVEDRAVMLSSAMDETGKRSTTLSEQLLETQSNIDRADASIGELQAKLADHAEETLAKLQGMRGGLAKLAGDTDALSESTQDKLRAAIASLEDATKSAFAAIEAGTREKLGAMAETIGKDAIGALDRSLRNESAEAIGRLEQAAAHASGVGREAAIQLRDQLAKVNELTGNLEQRVERARELAEEQVNNDFSRRMALITDKLNSSAIDITSALQADVADTAWEAYLKGDRGIFTRRAVRLIDNGEAREISELYSEDDAFRANVSRYIHDFEAMLRSMLSTRDGHTLGVTVLSSDMGKLYVVLAQAIQRFRN